MSIFSKWFKAEAPKQELKDAIKANVLDVVADGRITPEAATKLVEDFTFLVNPERPKPIDDRGKFKVKSISADIATFGDAAGVDRKQFPYLKGFDCLNEGDSFAVQCLAELLREFNAQSKNPGKASKTVPATGLQIRPASAAVGGRNSGPTPTPPVQQQDDQAKLDEIRQQAERDFFAGRGQSHRFPSIAAYAAAKCYAYTRPESGFNPDAVPKQTDRPELVES